jgi:hypothetical protein
MRDNRCALAARQGSASTATSSASVSARSAPAARTRRARLRPTRPPRSEDRPTLRTLLPDALIDDIEAVSQEGAFIQVFEFGTDRIAEWSAIQDRFAAAIGADRTTGWSILGADRDRPDTYVAIVEFPSHAAAMVNSENSATAEFLSELTAICLTKPEFRNLDVRLARPY